MDTPPSNQGMLASRYERMSTTRLPYIERGEKCAKLTIPSLLPPKGSNYTNQLADPFQSIGGQGVNNLASKLLLTQLPPGQPFFRFSIDEAEFDRLIKQLPAGAPVNLTKADLEKGFAKIERQIIRELETRAIRVPTYQAFQFLIVMGNALLFVPESGPVRVYRMDTYTVRRDPNGKVREIIIREQTSWEELDDKLKQLVSSKPADGNMSCYKVYLYTQVLLEGTRWKVRQEMDGKPIPLAREFRGYPEDKCPWIPLALNRIDGEDYGRGYIEQYLGDLNSCEGLNQAIVEAAAISSKVVFMVKPNAGNLLPKTLSKAENGDIVSGNKDDVGTLQVEKQADMRVAQETAEVIEGRLARAFLLNSAVQRNAERVTAEEIRYVAGELEDALGGVYSILTVEFQLRLLNRIIYTMVRRGMVPDLPESLVYPVIVTGVEALGRNAELNKIRLFIATLREFLPEAMVQAYIKGEGIIKKVGTATNVDTDDLVRTEDEVQANMRQQQMAAAAQAVVPKVAEAALTPQQEGTG